MPVAYQPLEPRPTRTRGFSLVKWYLDVVGADGEVFIGYAAALERAGTTIRYASTLTARPGQPPAERRSLRSSALPVQAGNTIRWSHRGLDVAGEWEARSAPIIETLLPGDDHRLVWRCLQPVGRASVRLAGGRAFTGNGYVERVELTIAPWRLPIDELRWGRFHGAGHAAVWIDWRGPAPGTWAYLDGKRVPGATVTDDQVGDPDRGMMLGLEHPVVIREGALGTGALARIPGIAHLAPARMLAAIECKWRSRGTLHLTGEAPIAGWAIHEVVSFRPRRPRCPR